MGVLHADEIDYVFGHPLNKTEGYSDTEADLSRKIMNYYKRFAATGRPVDDYIDWPIYDKTQPQYFEWNGADQKIGKGPRAFPCAFWNELMPLLADKQDGGVCDSEMQKALNNIATPVAMVSYITWIVSLLSLYLF
ncbi:hypothetical protein SK128_019787 [Halocaridina rubra]|uniref:Carboxylesterase type B domain-containing protein n=1 Tax=Halocaridina rubra TaxID=373956 RepID=A0AAN8WJL3_HALRR